MTKQLYYIMVVEDEELLLKAIASKIEKSGMKAISCASAEQAVDYLKNMEQTPDAIWLDYHLNGMDGLTFMNRLKKNKKWSQIPVLVVSNSASPAKVNNMLALGAKKYLIKAENRLEDIIAEFKKFVNKESA